ncbi:MAG: hypothetical protein JWN25_1388 [Verrucomicrobiales bacterium]|nr:hypothetical protein [Verrucomicrobiales bacterium]
MNDLERLQRFASGDQDAFTEIVRQHVNAVYSTAWRVLQNSHLAEEVTQDTFSLLAQKAPALRRDVIIIAWLHRTSWNLAMKTLRTETRRRDREQQITSTEMTTSTPDPTWKQISPILDEGIESLGEPDRRALLLRFFEEKTSSEISIALGISETAARSRVSRAVERLRLWFKKRGVTLTSASLITLLTTYSLQAAPEMLFLTANSAAKLTANSLIPVSFGTKLLIVLAKMKLKTAIISGVAVLFALLVANQIRININDQTLTATEQLPALLQDLKEQRKSVFAGLKSRLGNESAAEKKERQALEEIKGILYSKDSDSQLPPMGMREAILASGSRKREALDMLRDALHSGDRRASYRAAMSLQFLREFADELVPEILALMKKSTDGYLISSIASCGFGLNHQDTRRPVDIDGHDTQILPAVIEAFKANPAAAEGMRTWFGSYFRYNKTDQSAGLNLLSPLLDSPDSQQRLTAALLLAHTGGKDDPRLTDALLTGWKSKGDVNDLEILSALKAIGTPARSAGETVVEFARQSRDFHDQAYDTLALIAPDLRTQIPELDEKLKKLEAAAELENKMQSGKGSASDLLLALQNPEARMKAVESLGTLSDHASEILPRLREILNAGDSDMSYGANNYLDAVSRSIRKLDPSAPAYVSSPNMSRPLIEVSTSLDKKEDKGSKALGDKLVDRQSSPRPYTLEEVISIVEKIKAVDPALASTFVKKLGNTDLTEMQTLSAQLKEKGYGAK